MREHMSYRDSNEQMGASKSQRILTRLVGTVAELAAHELFKIDDFGDNLEIL